MDPSRGEWERYGDFCYHLGTEALTFDEAEAKCQDYGSSLTSIHSEAEQEYIHGKSTLHNVHRVCLV